MLQYSFDGGGRELGKDVINAVFVHGQPLPVDESALIKPQTVPLQAGVVSGFAVRIKKERLQDTVNLFRRSLDGVTVFLPVPLDGQEDIDGKPHLKHDDNIRAGGVSEVSRQRAVISCCVEGRAVVYCIRPAPVVVSGLLVKSFGRRL